MSDSRSTFKAGELRPGDVLVNPSNGKRTAVVSVEEAFGGSHFKVTLDHGFPATFEAHYRTFYHVERLPHEPVTP
jgi:hypothetical protein